MIILNLHRHFNNIAARNGGSIAESVFWFWETDMMYEISRMFYEVTTSCSIVRLIHLGKNVYIWPQHPGIF